jgi:hypothetical protein
VASRPGPEDASASEDRKRYGSSLQSGRSHRQPLKKLRSPDMTADLLACMPGIHRERPPMAVGNCAGQVSLPLGGQEPYRMPQPAANIEVQHDELVDRPSEGQIGARLV